MYFAITIARVIHMEVVKQEKQTHYFLLKNCKKKVCFYNVVEFLSKSKIPHAKSTDRETMLFYQALASCKYMYAVHL